MSAGFQVAALLPVSAEDLWHTLLLSGKDDRVCNAPSPKRCPFALGILLGSWQHVKGGDLTRFQRARIRCAQPIHPTAAQPTQTYLPGVVLPILALYAYGGLPCVLWGFFARAASQHSKLACCGTFLGVHFLKRDLAVSVRDGAFVACWKLR